MEKWPFLMTVLLANQSVNNFWTYGLGETFKINGRNYLYGVISYHYQSSLSQDLLICHKESEMK